MVETSQEVKNLSSVNPPQTLQPGDISNIATVLVKIVSVPQKANEVGYVPKCELFAVFILQA